MPFHEGTSPTTREENIKEMIRSGHDPKQAVAAAYSEARKSGAHDMGPQDWKDLFSSLTKWLREEMDEPEHAEDLGAYAQDILHRTTVGDEGIALDKSARKFDKDGRLHLATSNISKANVCPYYGREIPGYDELGLDPEKVYKLLRHPDELKKGAETFNNLPILSEHVGLTAEEHKPELVIGSTGTDAEFKHPYLSNSLVFWPQAAIDDIESEDKQELSSAYHYKPDMTPGEHEGERYDGVMRNIVGNHVALVKEGRAGSDVVVGDEAIKRIVGDDGMEPVKVIGDATNEKHDPSNGQFTSGGGSSGNGAKKKTRKKQHVWTAGEDPQDRVNRVKRDLREPQDIARSGNMSLSEVNRIKGHDMKPKRVVGDAGPRSHENFTKKAAGFRSKKPGGKDQANDSNRRTIPMTKKTVLTRKATALQGALVAYLAPKMAKDAKVDIRPALAGVTAKNFKANKPAIAADLAKLLKGKLAADANINDVAKLLDALEQEDVQEGADIDPSNGLPMEKMSKKDGEDDMEDMEMDDEPMAKAKEAIAAHLNGKCSPEDIAKVHEMMDEMHPAAADGETEEAEENADGEEGKKTPQAKDKEGPEMKPKMVTQKAMDSAIKAAVKSANENQKKIRLAEDAVRPYVGKLEIAYDSADEVYRHALETLEVDVDGVHPSAYPVILKQIPVPGTSAKKDATRVAADSSLASDFTKRIPGAGRIVVQG